MKIHARSRGFTLIELLIVVAIIAILAAIAVPNFLEAQVRSKVSRARADMRTITTALESYRVDTNKYPPMLGQNPGQPLNRQNGYGSIRAFAWRTVPHNVTTPIAYITSSVSDVFKIGKPNNFNPDAGRSFESGNDLDLGFVYHNIRQYVDEIGPPSWGDGDLRDYGEWRMFSLGPDGLFNSIGTADPTLGWIYDATNGTVSSGMILRTQVDTLGQKFTR
ncbi:MAG: prepilin-type N-terminal cleavage/methylation domain-containing protein [Sumerlaeia bacterium]